MCNNDMIQFLYCLNHITYFKFLLGAEKWDDVPRWKKDSNNEFSDRKSSNALGFEESPNNR